MMSKEAFKEKTVNGFNKIKKAIVDHKGEIIAGVIIFGTTVIAIAKAMVDQNNNDSSDDDYINPVLPLKTESETNDDNVIYYSKSDVFSDVAAKVLDEEYDVSDYEVKDSKIYATILSHKKRIPRPSVFEFDEDGDLTFYTVTYPGERTTYGIGSRVSRKVKEAYQEFENETVDETEE